MAGILAAATDERDTVRAEGTKAIANAQATLDAAVLAFSTMKKPQPVSSAAHVMGWSEQSINAILAGLKASSMNIGAIVAIAIAGHGLGGAAPSRVRVTARREKSLRDHVARFAVAHYLPDTSARLCLEDVRMDYDRWVKGNRAFRFDRRAFLSEFCALAAETGLRIENDLNGQQVVVGMAPIKLIEAA